jgi:PhnB protein
MKAINPYLNFDGKCREAMTFYSRALGGKLTMQTFKETGQGDSDRIMHARIDGENPATTLMASDSQPGEGVNAGNNIWLTIDCSDTGEQDRFFESLSYGGNVVMAPVDTFWGARFGMLKDKFGIGWMLNCELKK